MQTVALEVVEKSLVILESIGENHSVRVTGDTHCFDK